MAVYLGDHSPSTKVRRTFLVTSDGKTAVDPASPVVCVYKDGGTTQSTAGVTLTSPFDSVTGQCHVVVDLSADTAFYSAGSNFDIQFQSGTAGGTALAGTPIAHFSIHYRSPRRILPYHFLRKYNTATAAGTHLRVAIPIAGGGGASVAATWTPATGDVKISLDSAAEANIDASGGALPAYVNGAWEFALTAAQIAAKTLSIRVSAPSPKVIDDILILVETFGHASAMYTNDLTQSGPAVGADGGVQLSISQPLV